MMVHSIETLNTSTSVVISTKWLVLIRTLINYIMGQVKSSKDMLLLMHFLRGKYVSSCASMAKSWPLFLYSVVGVLVS